MEPVGLLGKQPDVLGTLSGLMQLKQQQQNFQRGAAETQLTQQDAAQRAALAKVDWNKYMGEDGTLSLDKLTSDKDVLSSLGDSAPAVMQQALMIRGAQIKNKGDLLKLNDDSLSSWGKIAEDLSKRPEVKAGTPEGQQMVKDAFSQWAQMNGPDAAKAVAPFALPVINGQIPPDKLADVLSHVSAQSLDVLTQRGLTKSAPTFVQAPGGLQGIETNQYAGPVGSKIGPSIEQGIAPGVTTNTQGQMVRIAPNASSVSVVAGANPTQAEAAANLGAAQGITERVQHAQAAANGTVQAQDALSRSLAILDNPNIDTGAAFEKFRGLKNVMASIGIDTDAATDANSLVKNLARYEAARATQAGLGGTDAARELAHNGSPNTAVDKGALKGIIKQSLATEKAVAAYARVQAKTTDPQQMQQNESEFQAIPNAIMGYEYGLSKTPQEADEFLKKHGISKEQMKKTRDAIKAFEAK